jgi:ABC-type multidrug transport system ATPase subunit
MGPSGSGKTTLLNFLSGRLVADNLTITGELLLNSVPCNSIEKYSNQIAYVMQDDILLATFSPREAFTFVANMRCPRLSEHEKRARVEDIIRELGL